MNNIQFMRAGFNLLYSIKSQKSDQLTLINYDHNENVALRQDISFLNDTAMTPFGIKYK